MTVPLIYGNEPLERFSRPFSLNRHFVARMLPKPRVAYANGFALAKLVFAPGDRTAKKRVALSNSCKRGLNFSDCSSGQAQRFLVYPAQAPELGRPWHSLYRRRSRSAGVSSELLRLFWILTLPLWFLLDLWLRSPAVA